MLEQCEPALPASQCSIYYPERDNTPGIILNPRHKSRKGFTLIELSIVLVIIGLVVGGVLVGQNLIATSAIRAQITQIEKFNIATNTFRGKFGFLPGDIPAAPAAQFGLASRGSSRGEGDGNGLIEGHFYSPSGLVESGGETVYFWNDLNSVNMIEGSYTEVGQCCGSGLVNDVPSPGILGSQLNYWFPQAAIGNGNYVYVWSGGISANDGNNYFGIAEVYGIRLNTYGGLYSLPSMTVSQASAIDKKIDDGFPQLGRIIAVYNNQLNLIWAAGGGAWASGASPGSAAPASSTSCYDNGGNAANPMQYSVEYNNGTGINCAISFRFQ